MSYHRTAGNVNLRPAARGGYATNPSGTAFVWPSNPRLPASSPPVAEFDLAADEATSSESSTPLAYERSWEMEPGLQGKLESLCRTGKCPQESLGECRKTSEVWKRLSDDQLDPLISRYPDYSCRGDYSKGFPRKTAAVGGVGAAMTMAHQIISRPFFGPPRQRARNDEAEAKLNLWKQVEKRREAREAELKRLILLHGSNVSSLPYGTINQTPLFVQ